MMTTTKPKPVGFPGTEPEYRVYVALRGLGYIEDVDFIFQSSQLGGRVVRGGIVLDFYLPTLGLGINVQGAYWHYGRHGQIAIDLHQRGAAEAAGIHIVFIDEADALRNARWYVEEAIAGRDHSTMIRG